ncbi:MAG: M56 family metallopeptidase [Candidatus Sulfopaludibacter sp.]|nr:M56 family metallopeptidase [Candidatus Sulfopaludibacter sp.]
MNSLNSASAAILGAVLNTLWQAAAATVLVWVALRYTGLTARVRHRVWWGWLAILLVLPLTPTAVHAWKGRQPAPIHQARVSSPVAVPQPALAEAPPRVQVNAKQGPLIALGIWLALVLLQAGRLVWSFRHLRSLKREARKPARELRESFDAWVMACAVSRPVRLLVSDRLTSPMAVGFRRPAVILPAALLDKLSADDLDHVILHELAHVARHDDWTNLAGRVTAALVGWHPAVAWVLRRIDREREIACDDWVVAATGAPRPYAASLARLFALCWTKDREILATGMAGRGSQLGDRIEMLVRRTGEAAHRGSLARVGFCTAVLLALLVGGSRAPRWVAFAQDAPPRALAHPVVLFANPQSFLGALVAAGYGDLPVDDIINLKNQGISPDFLRGVSQAGWGKLSVQQLIELRQRGVSPQYLHDIREAGIRDLNIQGVIDLRSRGVQPEYPREIHALGFGPFSAPQIMDFASHGVRLDLFRALKEGGFTRLGPSEVFDAQNSGLQAGNLREAKQYGASLSLSQIIKLKRAGVI